ncbi:MAG: cytochrome c [Bauldia sp.]|nr:cytochrome c [Bauldia sp.]
MSRTLPFVLATGFLTALALVSVGHAQGSGDDAGAETVAEEISGATVFADAGCVGCHGATGGGGMGPALAFNTNLRNTANVISRVLRGSDQMPAFASVLSDGEIAAVLTYVRTSWGNNYGEVTAEDVAAARPR